MIEQTKRQIIRSRETGLVKIGRASRDARSGEAREEKAMKKELKCDIYKYPFPVRSMVTVYCKYILIKLALGMWLGRTLALHAQALRLIPSTTKTKKFKI